MGKSQREKGKRGERQVVTIFNESFERYGVPIRAERNLEESHSTAGNSYDIRFLDDGEHLPDYQIQVKNWKKTALARAFSEAEGAGEGASPIGVSRETVNGRREWVAAVPLSLLADLIASVEA